MFYNKDFKLGILGGGQLGRMFIQAAIPFDVFVSILDPSPSAPCASLASEFVVGDFNDYQTVVDFGLDKDVLTIEIEHVNVDALEYLEGKGKKVYPSSRVLRIVQDKGLQKEFYKNHQIPTADFSLIEDIDDLKTKVRSFPVIQKSRTGGYDGKGVLVLKNSSDLDKGFDMPSVLEEHIDFSTEISVIIARNEQGESKSFPLVELEFNPQANLVEFLFSPARVSEKIEKLAHETAEKVAEKLDFVGILAVEMFVTKNEEVLVNEIAPRTHNSGHHSIEGNVTSQFEQHLRSILNLPLGDVEVTRPAVMINLLGEEGYQGEVLYEGLEDVLQWPDVHIHIYGKKETKPYRKMGHVTVLADDLNKAIELAKKVQKTIKVKSS